MISAGRLRTPSFGGTSIARWLSENHFEFVQVKVARPKKITAAIQIGMFQTRGGINAITLSEEKAERRRPAGDEPRMKRLEGRHETFEVMGSISEGVEVRCPFYPLIIHLQIADICFTLERRMSTATDFVVRICTRGDSSGLPCATAARRLLPELPSAAFGCAPICYSTFRYALSLFISTS